MSKNIISSSSLTDLSSVSGSGVCPETLHMRLEYTLHRMQDTMHTFISLIYMFLGGGRKAEKLDTAQ